ncbi:hypothetical protein [Streptomyces sp. NBC_00158]|uniref:hypothetical protein n=1 Tax=Streptomyces sp. NBC_00158 TaxID=2903627 RepID=UPI003250B3E8
MGADIDGVIEARGPDGSWETAADLLRFGLGRERHAWECLFGFGGGLGVDRPLFDRRGVPDGASDPVPRTCGELHHGHSYATWAEIAAVDWDVPLCDAPAWSWLAEWRPGPHGRLVLHDVVRTRDEVLDAAEEAFGEDLMPPEWPPARVSAWTASSTGRWSSRPACSSRRTATGNPCGRRCARWRPCTGTRTSAWSSGSAEAGPAEETP